jgi:PAS domain S-box-containing protein
MSIRSFLTLIIALMGAVLIAMAGMRIAGDLERSGHAARIAVLTKLSQSLLEAVISARIERSTVLVGMMDAGPLDDAAWQRLAKHRPIVDAMTARSIDGLRDAPIGDAQMLAQQVADNYARLQALRGSVDEALRQPRLARKLEVLPEFQKTSSDFVSKLADLTRAVDRAAQDSESDIDRLLALKQAALSARLHAGQVALRLEISGAMSRGWTPGEAFDAAKELGRAEIAWDSVLATTRSDGMAPTVRTAVEAGERALHGPEAKRLEAMIGEMQLGKPSSLPVSEIRALTAAMLDPIYEVPRQAMAETVLVASGDERHAGLLLAIDSAILAGILGLTGFGIAVVHKWVSQPIRRITRQMSRLKDSDIDFEVEDAGRADEIGEMARALTAFRQQVEERGRRLQEREMRQFLEALIDAMPVSITFKDTDLRYRYANRSRRAGIGDGSVEMVGMRLSDVSEDETVALVEQADRDLLATGESQQFEHRRTGADGKPAIVWAIKTPFRDAEGSIRGIITCGIDITRLKQIEGELVAQRERAEAANRAKSAFLASMSHELRTPLNAIIGFAEMLAEGYLGPLGSRQREYVDDIQKSGEHLLKMVNDLLDLSNLEIGRQVLQIADCRFDAIAAAALSMVQPQADKSGIQLDFTPTELDVRADERALTQILVNLLGNAIKFSPPGGRITLRATRAADVIRIQVEDTGIGMTEAQRVNALTATLAPSSHPADPYKARPKGGAGLGLAICRRLIEQHQGRIEIESQPSRGSTVNVVLPAA